MLLLIVILINFSWVDSTLCERRVKEFLGSEQPIRIEPTNSGIRVIQFGKTISQYPKTCQELIAEIPPPPPRCSSPDASGIYSSAPDPGCSNYPGCFEAPAAPGCCCSSPDSSAASDSSGHSSPGCCSDSPGTPRRPWSRLLQAPTRPPRLLQSRLLGYPLLLQLLLQSIFLSALVRIILLLYLHYYLLLLNIS